MLAAADRVRGAARRGAARRGVARPQLPPLRAGLDPLAQSASWRGSPQLCRRHGRERTRAQTMRSGGRSKGGDLSTRPPQSHRHLLPDHRTNYQCASSAWADFMSGNRRTTKLSRVTFERPWGFRGAATLEARVPSRCTHRPTFARRTEPPAASKRSRRRAGRGGGLTRIASRLPPGVDHADAPRASGEARWRCAGPQRAGRATGVCGPV